MIDIDLNFLKRLSRRQPSYPEPQRVALNQIWNQAQPHYSNNPVTGETVAWNKNDAFEKDAISQGFTPQEVERFKKESKL